MKILKTVFTNIILVSICTSPFVADADTLSQKMSGKILLQVEESGEGWYVDPDTQKRAYLGRPADAFRIMRELGLGIAHEQLQKYLDSQFPSNLAGKILLDVEENGEAYYVDPDTLEGYFLGKPKDAFQVMRERGEGVSNENLDEIAVHEKYKESKEKKETETQEKNNKTNTKQYNIKEIKKGVGHIMCLSDDSGNLKVVSEGSGTIWNLGSDLKNAVLTNEHVIKSDSCQIAVDGGQIHFLDLENDRYQWNEESDLLVTTIKDPEEDFFKISSLENCKSKMSLNTKVYILGYPDFASKSYQEAPGIPGEHMPVLTITDGIVSAHDQYVENLPYVDYYVSAKIDSGSSGGLALAETDNGYCVLGIPTWLNIGNYETQGIVQNIHNITHKNE